MPDMESKLELTKATYGTAKVKAGKDRSFLWSKDPVGFGLMVTAAGHKSFVFQYRIGRHSRRMNLDGRFLRLEAEREAEAKAKAGIVVARREPPVGKPYDAAKAEAKAVDSAIRRGRDPLVELRDAGAAKTTTLRHVAEEFFAQHEKLRSLAQRRKVFERLIFPRLGNRSFTDITRDDVRGLLDGSSRRTARFRRTLFSHTSGA